jgi:hypothetical protein
MAAMTFHRAERGDCDQPRSIRATTARDLRSAGALKVDLMLSTELACSGRRVLDVAGERAAHVFERPPAEAARGKVRTA